MTKKSVLIDAGPGETRIAFLEDGRLAEVTYERAAPDEDGAIRLTRADSLLGDLFLGRVKRVMPGMQAAFVDIGLGRNGFLCARDVRRMTDYAGEPAADPPPITELVHEGQALLVQIVKDPIGDKGARLTASITIAGRLLILAAGSRFVALSRRIVDETERARLNRLAEEIAASLTARSGLVIGFILRTAAIGSSREAVLEDAERLVAQWAAIKSAAAQNVAPAQLYRNVGAVARVVRDHLDADTDEVIVNDAMAFAEIKRYAQEIAPALAGRIILHGSGRPLFEIHDIEAELERLLVARVSLPSGGWITIETTEALTAIDVNSGSLETGCLEETALRTNLAAAREIGRQLRLRGIGGLIVVDFIHQNDAANALAVVDALRETLAADRAPTQMTGMSVFGLVEITRKRVREPLSRLLTENCEPCGGQARIPTAATIGASALRRLAGELGKARAWQSIRIRAEPAVAAWLLARRRMVVEPLQRRLGCPIEVEPARDYPRERFEILPVEVSP